ncbi:MAG: hypothetical protein JWL70_3188 [Acidimicrobiia bacterium]|nr:hypothetical protein [Acidimicrobiia bacterium]
MDHVSPPKAVPDALTSPFWEGANKGQLLIQRCQKCGTYIHLPRPVCSNCLSFDLAPEAVSGRGTLYSFTITYKAFHPFFVDKVPYVLAVVELAEQTNLRVLSNLVGVDEADIRIGMDLMVDFQELEPGYSVPIFKAAGAS